MHLSDTSLFNPIQDRPYRGCLLPNICQLYLTYRISERIYKSRDAPLEFCRHQNFFLQKSVIFVFVCIFLDCTKMRFFKYTYFNCLLAVRVRVILQLAKIFWSRKDEIFHWFFGSSSIASLALKQQAGSLLGINIPYCLWKKNSMFNISRSTQGEDPIFGRHMDTYGYTHEYT